ncbi:SEA domain-containing protein [Phthorimaea operculella]|nr:SEA domain-containing protein [Phthorimaea operculella]
MGRRRWRFVTIAAFLLYMIRDAQCQQDENDFYYTPVERSFAQVQPPLFPNNRPSTYFEHGDNFRVSPPTQQPLYNEGHVRFPSPNYNQNPSPFQLPTGRSQAGTPYYSEEVEEYEYYDEPESSEVHHTTTPAPEHVDPVTDIYDEYDGTEDPERGGEEYEPNVTTPKANVTKSFDVVTMSSIKGSMVKDDNFKDFVDTPVIDQTVHENIETSTSGDDNSSISAEDVTSIETPSILGQEVVSVVTTKSVVNAVEQEEKKQTIDGEEEDVSEETITKDPLNVSFAVSNSSSEINSSSSTENINDKLDSIQSELSSAVLSGSLDDENKNIELITETTTEQVTTPSTTTTTTQGYLNVFTLKSTQQPAATESTKNRVILLDDKSLLPKEYKPKEKSPEDHFRKFQKDDLSKLLPSSYKPVSETNDSKAPIKSSIFDKIEEVDISALLPKGFKLNVTTTTAKHKLPVKTASVDITALLPPGFKLNETEKEEENSDSSSLLDKFKVADISSLLPPGFKLNATEKPKSAPSVTTTKPTGRIKLSFGGSKLSRKTTEKPLGEAGPPPITPKIMKGWPTRASTEFTGWPSPSTTPFSIEKYLLMNKTVTEAGISEEASSEMPTRRTTTTTTTTIAPPPPTTPGVCRHECDIAATIKIVAGVKWVPELLDHHTKEWQTLAEDVKEELNSVYAKSDLLKKWYKGIRIDSFSPGSVLVDYFIELNKVEEKVDTLELKKLFHKSLNEAKPGSVVETITEEPQEFDPDVMLGDQPEEERMRKSNEKMTKTIDKSAGKLEIGKFVMDPAYTEFIVLPKREEPTIVAPDEESFLPQWGIAVIVIALASLLFVVIFGVTVLVNRQKSAKAKAPIPLSEDMLRELDKSHMGGFDDIHQMKERDLPYLPSGKRMSTAFIEQLAYQNPGDSWRSEWTPQMQKYMQHYTPDSGRGSQIYGTAGNAYGYNGGGGSQLYGQTGGGSQVYGYTGEYPAPRSHYSRRRSDYDSNF